MKNKPFIKYIYRSIDVKNKVPSIKKSRYSGPDIELRMVLTVWEVLFHPLIFPPPFSAI